MVDMVDLTGLDPGVTRVLGRSQIFIGSAAAGFQIVLIGINSEHGVPFLAAGIWAGFFFVLAGFAALAAAARPSRCYVITLMVLSIIASVTAVFGLFLCSVLDLHVTRRNCEYFDYFSEVYYDEDDAASAEASRGGPITVEDETAFLENVAMWGVAAVGGNRRVYGIDGEIEVNSPPDSSKWYACSRPSYVMALILDASLLVLAVASTITSIWCSVLCCRAVCFPDTHPRFLYISPSPGDVEGNGNTHANSAAVHNGISGVPVAAVVCVPVATHNIVTSSSQFVVDRPSNNGAVFTSATFTETRSEGQVQPLVPSDNLVSTSVISPAVAPRELPPYDPAELPPYQATPSYQQDLSLPPYNPNFPMSTETSISEGSFFAS